MFWFISKYLIDIIYIFIAYKAIFLVILNMPFIYFIYIFIAY